MAERIHVVPDDLRQAAGHHQETSEYLRTLPSSHEAIQQSLDSLGPIFADLRETGRELLEQRRLCYEQQADQHAEIASDLTQSAGMWEQHDIEAAARIAGISDDGR